MKALNHQPENQQWMSNIEKDPQQGREAAAPSNIMSNIESKDIKLQHECEEH